MNASFDNHITWVVEIKCYNLIFSNYLFMFVSISIRASFEKSLEQQVTSGTLGKHGGIYF